MEVFPKGTKENLIVDVSDKLGNLTTLDGTNPNFDVRLRNDDTWVLQNSPVINIGMTAYCLVDTATWEIGIYELFTDFTSLPERPRIGPIEFEVAHA